LQRIPKHPIDLFGKKTDIKLIDSLHLGKFLNSGTKYDNLEVKKLENWVIPKVRFSKNDFLFIIPFQLGNVLTKFGCSKQLEFPNGVVVNDRQVTIKLNFFFVALYRKDKLEVFDHRMIFRANLSSVVKAYA